jgi:hypothetical protein
MGWKVLSVAYALGFFVTVYDQADAGAVLPSAVFLLIPLLCIWFPQELGAWLGRDGLGVLKAERPALWTQRIGWGLLFLAPLIPLALS